MVDKAAGYTCAPPLLNTAPHMAIERAASFSDVNSQIDQWQTQASILPFRHPDRAAAAHNIAFLHLQRYKATNQRGDLDQAIVGYAEALLRGTNRPPVNILTFGHLTDALLFRLKDFGAREDLDHIISYHRHLSSLPLEVAGIRRVNVLNNLSFALLCRFGFEWRLDDIEDSIASLQHAVTMVPPDTDHYRLIASNLANAWKIKYERTGD